MQLSSRAAGAIALNTLLAAIILPIVLARLWTRRVLQKTHGAEDILIFLATVSPGAVSNLKCRMRHLVIWPGGQYTGQWRPQHLWMSCDWTTVPMIVMLLKTERLTMVIIVCNDRRTSRLCSWYVERLSCLWSSS